MKGETGEVDSYQHCCSLVLGTPLVLKKPPNLEQHIANHTHSSLHPTSLELSFEQMFKTGFIDCMDKYFKLIYEEAYTRKNLKENDFILKEKKKKNTTTLLFTIGLVSFQYYLKV